MSGHLKFLRNTVLLILGVFLGACASEYIDKSSQEKDTPPTDKPQNPEPIKFNLLDFKIFETKYDPKQKVFVTGGSINLAIGNGEATNINLSTQNITKLAKYEYLEQNEFILRDDGSFWVVGNETVAFYASEESAPIRGSLDSNISFENIYYVDKSNLIALMDTEILRVSIKQNDLSLSKVSLKNLGEIIGAGLTKEGAIWIASLDGSIKKVETTQLTTLFSVPELPAEGKITGFVGSKLGDSNILLRSNDKLYTVGALATLFGLGKAYDWARVKQVSDLYCVRCHSEDGFESESTWLETKKSSLVRVFEERSMPPSYSLEAEKILDSEFQGVLDWLLTDGKPADDEDDKPDEPSDKPGRTDEVPANVLAIVEANCASCHSTITRHGYWYDKYVEIKSEVIAGSMPQNGSLNETEKSVLTDFADKIKNY